MRHSALWEVWGRVIANKRIHYEERAFIVAENIEGAVRGYEQWGRHMWPDGFKCVEVDNAHKTHDIAIPS